MRTHPQHAFPLLMSQLKAIFTIPDKDLGAKNKLQMPTKYPKITLPGHTHTHTRACVRVAHTHTYTHPTRLARACSPTCTWMCAHRTIAHLSQPNRASHHTPPHMSGTTHTQTQKKTTEDTCAPFHCLTRPIGPHEPSLTSTCHVHAPNRASAHARPCTPATLPTQTTRTQSMSLQCTLSPPQT